jgi:hypothetical protein
MLTGISGADTLAAALQIEDSSYYELWVELLAPSQVIVNRYYHVRVAVGNRGNDYAFGVPVHIRFDGNREAVLVSQTDDRIVDSFVLAHTPWQRFYKEYDSISPTQIDSNLFTGLVVGILPPHSTEYIDFLIRSSAADSLLLTVSVLPPYYQGASLDSMGLRSSCQFMPPCIQCILDWAGFIHPVACLSGIIDMACLIGQGASGSGGGPKFWSVVGGLGSTILHCVPVPFNPFVHPNYLLRLAAGVAGHATNAGHAASGFLPHDGNPPACPACFDPDTKKRPILARFAGDPNTKEGPVGFTPENYISGDDPIYYRVSFENMATATAPAQVVLLKDVLDSTVFNLSSIAFAGYGFGDTTVYLPEEVDSFTSEVDLRPIKNTIVRTRGWFEQESSTLKARYSSFDPVTMDNTDTIDNGFLPPNVNAPEGEGFLMFRVNPKPSLPHLTVLENLASIYFDSNAAVITPVWTNTIDRETPQSAVNALPATTYDTLITVSWSGSDAHAGLMDYDIYVSEDNGPHELWISNATRTSAIFTGEFGKQYAFYSVARDHVMNEEDEPAIPDAQTSLAVGVAELSNAISLEVIPNPASDAANVQFTLTESSHVKLTLYNAQGNELQVLARGNYGNGFHEIPVAISSLHQGTYIISLQTTHSGPQYCKLIICR